MGVHLRKSGEFKSGKSRERKRESMKEVMKVHGRGTEVDSKGAEVADWRKARII